MLSMIKKVFSATREDAKKEAALPNAHLPQVMGLRLGGSVRLNDLFLRVNEQYGLLDGPSREVLIQALGIVKVDDVTTLLRYYTSDDGFIQVNVKGALRDENVDEMTLWYYSNTQSVANDPQWEVALRDIPQPAKAYEGHAYESVWDMTYDRSLVSIVETVHDEEGGTYSVDEFFMLFQRKIIDSPETFELLLVNAEEKGTGYGGLDRSVVTSIGYHLKHNNFETIS